MSEGIDRRNLMVAAGAAVALNGCKQEITENKAAADILSRCPDFGDSPLKVNGKKPPNSIAWKPEHYCVVYINMDDGLLVAKHAYYKTGFSVNLTDRENPSSKKTEAIAALRDMASNGVWPGTPIYPSDNFEDFWFGSQQEIYIFVDGKLAKIDPQVLLVFSANKTKPSNPEMPQKNKTFYNAHALSKAIGDKDVAFVQNWFLDRTGNNKISNPNPNNHKKRPDDIYAMNIHILLGTAEIPGVIDPDTGNGAGNEP